MRKAVIALALVTGGCGAQGSPPAVEIRYQTVTKEVLRPCPVTKPKRPEPLARPLPNGAVQIAALLGAKLNEWAAAGGYGDRADAALDTCIKP